MVGDTGIEAEPEAPIEWDDDLKRYEMSLRCFNLISLLLGLFLLPCETRRPYSASM